MYLGDKYDSFALMDEEWDFERAQEQKVTNLYKI